MIRRVIYLFLLLYGFIAKSGNQDTITYFKTLRESKTDAEKVSVLIKLAKHFLTVDVNRSFSFTNQAKVLAEKSDATKQLAEISFVNGDAFYLKLNYKESEKSFTEALLLYDKAKDEIGKAEALAGLGKVAFQNNNVAAALAHYGDALKIFEKHNYKDGLAGLYINLALVYEDGGNLKTAVEFYNKGLKTARENNDVVSEASCYTNLGNIYTMEEKYDLAIESHKRSIELKQKIGNKPGEGTSLNNLGVTYYQMGNIDKALECFQSAYKIYVEIDDKKSIFPSSNNIASIFHEKKDYDKALEFYTKSYKVAQELNSISKRIVSLEGLSLLHKDMGNLSQALDYSILCMQLKDTLYNKEQAEINAEMQTKFATEKKQQENEMLNLQLKSETLVKTIFIVLAFAMLLLAFFIFRGLRQKQKSNLILSEKNKIIEEQKHIVEEQNKDITDSIKYAERIQHAILPPDKLWSSLLPDSFVYYKPKDILSGDFYWIEKKDDFVFFAVADCTGHGVPGALMSIVNYNLLNKAVLEKGYRSTGDILNYVNNELTVSLHQSYRESSVRDGMDISICAFNTKTKELQYSGANNPVYLIRGGTLSQLNADKYPIGSFVEETMPSFTSQTLQLEKGDVMYLFSDGYADQFGGPNGKKFKYKQLKEMLVEIHSKPVAVQKEILDTRLNDWKGTLEQVDDICVIGVKF